MFKLWHKWLGPQWSIGDFAGMQAAMATEIPGWMLAALRRMAPAGTAGPADTPPQNLREYDPQWGDAFTSWCATVNCDHHTMLRHVKVPVLFTHHFRYVDPDTGNVLGAITDQQVRRVRQLIKGAGNSFAYRDFPTMPHSMHGHDPATYAAVVIEWLAGLP